MEANNSSGDVKESFFVRDVDKVSRKHRFVSITALSDYGCYTDNMILEMETWISAGVTTVMGRRYVHVLVYLTLESRCPIKEFTATDPVMQTESRNKSSIKNNQTSR